LVDANSKRAVGLQSWTPTFRHSVKFQHRQRD
jgi:hypothetical protein